MNITIPMTKQQITDAIVGILINDFHGIEQVYKEFKPKINAFIFNICKDFGMSEDLSQDTFANIIINADKFDSSKDPINWIYTIAHNNTISYIRKKKREVCIDCDNIVPIFDRAWIHSSDFIQSLDKLNTDERIIIYLKLVDDLRFEDISKIIEKNINSVKWKYYNALRKIKIGD